MMKALASSASNVILDKYRDIGFVSSRAFHRHRTDVLCLSPKKLVSATRFLQHKALQPISALTSRSDAQAEQETVAQTQTQTQTTYESKTVHVKFHLQKECLFGEQFFLIGDDPMLGLWEPASAIPMEWSDGHIWTVELDIPLGKSIQFKFIRKENTGDIVWQPGPDRILQTWETKNAITVCEYWENAEYQKIIEEDPAVYSETLVADNVTQPKEAAVSDVNNITIAVDAFVDSAKIPEQPEAMVAENIGYPKEDPVLSASDKVIGEKQIRQPEEELAANKNMTTEEDVVGNNDRAATVKNLTTENKVQSKEDLMLNVSNKMIGEIQVSQPEEEVVANKNMLSEEDTLRNNGRAATFKNLTAENIGYPKEDPVLNANNKTIGGKQISEPVEESLARENVMTKEGDAVLVPGLTPLPMPAEGEIQDENEKGVPVDASVGNIEAVNQNVPKLEEMQDPQIDRHEEEKVEIFNEEEQHRLDDEQKHQMTHAVKQEQQLDAKPLPSNVLEHDIRWGRRTLQTLLSNLGLM